MSCSQECDQPASCPPGRDIEFEQTCSCSAEAPPFARLVAEVDPAAWLGNYFEIVLLLVQSVTSLATEVQDNTCFWTWSTSIIFSSSQWSVEFKHCFIIASYWWAFPAVCILFIPWLGRVHVSHLKIMSTVSGTSWDDSPELWPQRPLPDWLPRALATGLIEVAILRMISMMKCALRT